MVPILTTLTIAPAAREAEPAMSARPQHDGFHIPSLDGFRAVAALIVFASHAGLGHIVPGGLGVTVFFFLSGYLITTLLRREYEQSGRIHFRNFYLRRMYRIFPPMYLILAGLLLLSLTGVIERSPTVGGVASQFLQMTNYYVIDYPDTNIIPFTGIYWSLAVEEHFYLLFPLLFVFTLNRWDNRVAAGVFLFLCVLELAWRCILVYQLEASNERVYFGTDTRLDGLLFGCIMGVWMNPMLDRHQALFRSLAAELCMLAGALALLVLTLVYRDAAFRDTFRYSLQGVALFPIFWLAIRHPHWPIFRWLSWKPVVWLGLVSYVFYLSHVFWLHVAERASGDDKLMIAVLGFMMTAVFSALMYRFVEQPFAALRRKLHVAR